MLSSSARSEGDEGTKRVTQVRCESDGLCAEKVGTNSLELGYRRGDRELRMDVIYRRYGRQMKSKRLFSVRIIDPRGTVFVDMGSGSEPDGWSSSSPVPLSDENDLEGPEERIEMCGLMLEAMLNFPRQEFAEEEAWLEAKEQLADIVTRNSSSGDEEAVTRYFYADVESTQEEVLNGIFGSSPSETSEDEHEA